jgi:hypothetical protein
MAALFKMELGKFEEVTNILGAKIWNLEAMYM